MIKYLTQDNAPILEALKKMKAARLLPFDVPGHKRGRGNPELLEFLGDTALSFDVNSMKMLDNLCHPVSVIREAEILAAEAFKAAAAFFMVNGTSSAVEAMIMYAVKSGEKIIMPRNVHRSAINALILSGGVPVYVNPDTNDNLGIALGMKLKDVEKAVEENPDAKAVFVNNPTYYGVCSNIKEIVKLAHKHGMLVLADEAHGTHLYFNDKLPVSAMEAGADMAAVSLHKSGGSLTQSSLLLMGKNVNAGYARQIVNLTQTTSASYLLMASLDVTRRNLYLNGNKIFDKVIQLVEYARDEINAIGDYYAYSREITDSDAAFDFDITKLSIYTCPIGLTGLEVYDVLRDEYDIQIEFGDLGNILAYVSVGDREKDIERLVAALSEIRRNYKKDSSRLLKFTYIEPKVIRPPKEAFYADKKSLPLEKCAGEISAELVMAYPPGIPILSPGELITKEILDCLKYSKKKGAQITGAEDMTLSRLNVMEA